MPRRPAIVTWLSLAVLLLGAANLLAVYGAVTRRLLLAELSLVLPLGVLAAGSAVWGVVFTALGWGLLGLREWARRWMLAAFPLYEVMLIGQQIAFAQGAYERGRLPFAALTGAALAGLVVLVLTHRATRRAFMPDVSSDKEPED